MTIAITVLSIALAIALIWAVVATYKLQKNPDEQADLRQRAASSEDALAAERLARSLERQNYESKLARARARRTECENAWVENANPSAVLDHLRGLDDELQPVHKDGGQGGEGGGGEAGQVPPRP